MPQLGDRVKLKRGRTGVVKFIGEVHFAKGQTIGLELDQWDPNANDGTAANRTYFKCAEGRGYFTKLSNLIENLGPAKPQTDLPIDDKPKAPLPEPPKVSIGDHVKLSRGKTGVVKYVGATDFSNGEEIVGIELDMWTNKGHDGKNYFKAVKGRGYFTKRESIATVIVPTEPSKQEEKKRNY